MESEKKNWINDLIYKAETDTDKENKRMDTKGERGVCDELGDWD